MENNNGAKVLSLALVGYEVTTTNFVGCLSPVITRRLIFARANWMKHKTWHNIGRSVSGDTHRSILYPLSDFIEERKTRKEVNFSGLNFSDLVTV